MLIVADAGPGYGRAAPKREEPHCHSVLVKVDDVDAHHDRARQRGARIAGPPGDYPCGERQYPAEDLEGHRWTFTRAIADLAPEERGGTPASALTDGGTAHLPEPR
jgi:uncharacterized glyoxalase superfamily protein PhnB